MNFSVIPARYAPYALSLLRIATGLAFLDHGTGKILGFPALPNLTPGPMMYFTGLMELIGGVLIILGLLTRPVAFLLSGYMAVAYFLAHAPHSVFPVLNGGDAAILYCFIFLYLAAAGPGPLSVDRD
jgi:putative oxidoreductase